ncbi:MAG: hypothetical protein KGI27_04580 [Thaumarchaeota archaeon]|nr:hypothetical protein [Nitrososphaerota archaeon]
MENKIQNQNLTEVEIVSRTIYEQLKGTCPTIFAMLGVRTVVQGRDSLTLKLGGVQEINAVVIRYDEGWDLYDIGFWNCRVLTREPFVINDKLEEKKGIYWDQMAQVIISEVSS